MEAKGSSGMERWKERGSSGRRCMEWWKEEVEGEG